MTEEEKDAIEIVKQISTKDLMDSWDVTENYNAIKTVLNLIDKMFEIIDNKNKTIESLSLESDKWFISSVNKQKAYVELERKTDEIIDELITALAEERGIDEDEIREDFLNDR